MSQFVLKGQREVRKMYIMQSVEMLAERFPGDVKVYPGHGDATTMADEIAHNPFLA